MEIVKEPDVFLRDETQEIEVPLDDDNKKLIADMIQTMYDNNGIGLAANQVGFNRKTSKRKINPRRRLFILSW